MRATVECGPSRVGTSIHALTDAMIKHESSQVP